MEDERPSPSSSENTCTQESQPTEAEESAPSPQRRGKLAQYVHRRWTLEKEKDEQASPQGDQPFPKWYTQLLDGADVPKSSNEAVPPRRSRRLEEQRRARLLEDAQEEPTVRRSKRIEEQRRAQENIVNYALMSQVASVQEPNTLVEAQEDEKWMEAMWSEYNSIMKNHTWDLVDRPNKCKVIDTKWVYKVKYKSDGTLEKYKARLVAKGFAQVEGFDFQETFAPTTRMTTIHMVLALAIEEGWPVYQMDVKSAFLNGNLKEEVYIEQPSGFMIPGSESKVCRLRKALYGLKQAPRAWYQRIDTFFRSIGLHRSPSDANMYVFSEGGLHMVIILYVDDLIITGSHQERISHTQELLWREFEMTDLGLMHFCLGIKVWQEPGNIFISQSKYVGEILKAFRMTECKSVGTPMEVDLKLSMEDTSPLVDERLYQKLVGSLIFLCNTRPDINFAVGVLSRFSNKPRENHWNVGMQILRYLKGTQEYGINYNTGKTLIGFCDSDWAGDVDSRHSVTGYCFTLGFRLHLVDQ